MNIKKHKLTSAKFWPLMIAIVIACFTQSVLTAPGDQTMPRKGDDVAVEAIPPSIFPHWIHRIRYRCDACHDRLFKMELGATEISMELISKGESCGTCHNGQTAFKAEFQSCARCHVSTQN